MLQIMAKRMDKTRKAKVALMAAASVLAGAAALSPAQASDIDSAANPTMIEAPMSAIDPDAADHGDDQKTMTAAKWTLLATAAAALAGIVKLIGARKLARAAGKAVSGAAKVSAEAAAGAGRVIGRAVASPLRFAALMTGLALFSLTGLWLFDIEWMGGLIVGAAMAGVAVYGTTKTRSFLQRARVLKSKE